MTPRAHPIFRLLILALLLGSSQATAPAQRPGNPPAVPAPRDVLGFAPGDDRKLADWSQIVEYFKRLDAASGRVSVHQPGLTTERRPFLVALRKKTSRTCRASARRNASWQTRACWRAAKSASASSARPRRSSPSPARSTRPRSSPRRCPWNWPTGWRATTHRRPERCCAARCSCSCRRSTPTASTSSPTGIARRSARSTRALTRRCSIITTQAMTTTATGSC